MCCSWRLTSCPDEQGENAHASQTALDRHRDDARAVRHHRRDLSRCGDWTGPGTLSAAGQRVVGDRERPRGRERVDRAGVHAPRILPPASVGGGEWLRRNCVGRNQQGIDGPQARRHARRAGGRACGERRRRREGEGAVRHGDGIRLRSRSAHLPGERLPPGLSRRPSTERRLRRRARSARPPCRGPAVRLLRRAARERPAPQHRPPPTRQ